MSSLTFSSIYAVVYINAVKFLNMESTSGRNVNFLGIFILKSFSEMHHVFHIKFYVRSFPCPHGLCLGDAFFILLRASCRLSFRCLSNIDGCFPDTMPIHWK